MNPYSQPNITEARVELDGDDTHYCEGPHGWAAAATFRIRSSGWYIVRFWSADETWTGHGLHGVDPTNVAVYRNAAAATLAARRMVSRWACDGWWA